MGCPRCQTEMKNVAMGVNPQGKTACLLMPSKGLFESEKRCLIDSWVCPECGHVELTAQKPELFR